MKTNPSLRIFKSSTLVPLGIAIAAALVTQPLRATASDTLVITEESSSSLDVVLNGTDITATGVKNTSADHWTITVPAGAIIDFSPIAASWAEPENAGLDQSDPTGWNSLTWVSSTQLSLVSDTSFERGNFAGNNGIVLFSPQTFRLNDVSDAASTPDTGSTLGLLSLSVVALLGATRLRFLQLAA